MNFVDELMMLNEIKLGNVEYVCKFSRAWEYLYQLDKFVVER